MSHTRFARRALAFLLALACSTPALAQEPAPVTRADSVVRAAPARVVEAVTAGQPPLVDGRLDEPLWRGPSAGGFTQVEPRDGEAPAQASEVWVAVDREALYVAARLHDGEPSAIVGRRGRRDANTNSDLFTVAIDSWHDHRTAFRFTVNPAGVKLDDMASNDVSEGDASWDPVWDVATRVDGSGWTVEMRIPLSQLRFSGAAAQDWGIEFERRVQRTGELSRWQWWPNSETGYASRFGHLARLRDVASALSNRLEILPFVVAQGDAETGVSRDDPFNAGHRASSELGADLKYRLTPSLTITGTVNPDFGQVEADPAEVNVSIYETYFQERRPFFVEGANLFTFGAGSAGQIYGAPQLFYSRRVGRPPSGGLPDESVFAAMPEVTRILGAAKLSGKAGAWSLGLLDAVTRREEARVQLADGSRSEVDVEPMTNYAVASLRRDFRGGASGVGLFATSVLRDLDTASLAFLRTSAHSAGLDFFHRFGRNQFSISGTASGSLLRGSALSIALAQRSGLRYYQRPDQDYVEYDPARTSLSGWATSLSGGKSAGSWLWGSDFYAYSPGFETNDAGFLSNADRVFHGVRLTRRWLRGAGPFRYAQAYLNGSQSWNFGGTRVSQGVFGGWFAQSRGYWATYLNANFLPAVYNDKATRGGPEILQPSQWSLNTGVTSDSRRRMVVTLDGNLTRNRSGGFYDGVSLDIAYRPSTAFSFAFAPSLAHAHSEAGYVTTAADSTARGTWGRRYIVSSLDQRTLDLTMRAELAMTSALTLQLYAQPFASAVAYDRFKALERRRSFDFLVYGQEGASTLDYDAETRRYVADADGAGPAEAVSFSDPDFRSRSLRSNLVLRWDYRPGSSFYVAWAHGRSTAFGDAAFRGLDDLGDLFADDHRDRVLVKLSYWFNP